MLQENAKSFFPPSQGKRLQKKKKIQECICIECFCIYQENQHAELFSLIKMSHILYDIELERADKSLTSLILKLGFHFILKGNYIVEIEVEFQQKFCC